MYIARYNFDKDGKKIEFKNIKKILTEDGIIVEESFNQYLRRRFTEEYSGEYEVSERGSEAVEKLYNSWLESIGNPTNVYEANSREANENLLLDTYLTVLTDKKIVDQTRLPLDKVTGIIKDEILPIVDGPSSEKTVIPFKELSPTYQMNKKYEYSGGKTGIGPFALNNKNHILTQLANLKFADNSLLKSLGFTGLDGIKSRNEMVCARKDGNIIIEDGKAKLILEEGIRILDWISAMINAHVDVAKDPYVIRLNVRQYTYNICNFLLRVGYGKNTFYFLPQPILKEMAVAYDAAAGIYGVDSNKSKTAIVNSQIKKIRNKYFAEYEKACKLANRNIELQQDTDGSISFTDFSKTLNQVASDLMGRDNLIELLQMSKRLDKLSPEELVMYYSEQLLISELFIQLNDLALDMSKLVQLSQIDTKRYGNNFIEQDRFLYRLKSLMANTTLFDSDDLMNYYRTTFLYTKLVNGVIEPANIFEPLLLRGNQSFKNAITKVLSMTNRVDTNDESLNKQISNELEGLLRYKFIEEKNIDLFDMLYGENNMANRLAKIKSDILNSKYEGMLTQDGKISNKLLSHLGTLTRMSTDKYFAPSIITKNRISDGDKYLKQTLSTYWEELLDSPYEEIRNFANDLFYYQLATTAGNFTKNGIFNITPIRLITESGYNEFMRNQVNSFIGDSSIDYDNFFLNNWKNNKLVKSIDLYKDVYDKETNEIVKQFALPVLMSNDKLSSINRIYPLVLTPSAAPIGRNSLKQNIYQPYVKVVLDRTTPAGTILYKYVGNVENDKGIERPLYVVVSKKGLNDQSRVVKEYDSYSNSLFEFNNIENALNAKEPITFESIESVIKLGNPKQTAKWTKLLNTLTIVHDYIPNTKALNMDLMQYEVAENVTKKEESVVVLNNEPIEVTYKPGNSYTFSDGFTVELPFKLNEQQIGLLQTLEDFINNPKKYNRSITISGYAGTGKTTMIGIFNKWLEYNFIRPIFSSPTHRANAVTRVNNPNANVKTLHSVFGLGLIIDLENGVYDLRKMKSEQINKPKIEPGQTLIIDEASMVSESLYKFVEDFKKEYGINVIYVGDSALLSPVNDSLISPVFRLTDSKVELTKVERTGDNPILAEATALREDKDLSYTTHIVNGEGVEYIPSNSPKVDEIINSIVNSEEYKSNPLYFRILSATNNMLTTANNKVRKQLFGENRKLIEVGEILMGYDNIGREDNALVRNSIDYIVTEVSEKKTKKVPTLGGEVNVEGYDVKMKIAATDEEVDKLFVIDNNISSDILRQIAEANEEINRAISDAFKAKDYDYVRMLQKIQGQFKRDTILMKNLELGKNLKLRKTLDYGYAHTIHKSQGGTYNKVMIYLDTIGVFDQKVQQQLKYVAVSRAKENVFIVTDNKLNEPMIQESSTENVNNTSITDNDSINFNNIEQSNVIISSDKTILSNEELIKIRPFTGDNNPRIAVASEHTDPVFFSNKIISILEGKDSVEDKFRKTTYSGKDFAALYLITKHDGLPLKKLLEYKIPKLIHFSITGLGGTKYEPGVMKADDLLDRIAEFIKQGLDPSMVTVRIDPIIPGVTTNDVIENIVKRASEIGIKNIRFSVMDQYSTTKKFMENIGYDYSKYYDGNSLHAKDSVLKDIAYFMSTLKDKYKINLSTCAEPFDIPGISKEACLSVSAINNMLGTSIPDSLIGKQRKLCSCYGGKTDLLRYNNKCASSCVYCYAHHNANANAIYYNEDGSLKDNPLTRTQEKPMKRTELDKYTLHSGGANGADTVWGEIGKEFGVYLNHYYSGNKTPNGNIEISEEDKIEGQQKVTIAARQMGRIEPNQQVRNELLIRDWAQVKYADAVFAITTMLSVGDEMNYGKKAKIRQGKGGTGYAMQMAINEGKPVYIYDQVRKQWFKNIKGEWSVSDVPTLPNNFAGIGTREITQDGIQAIRDVYNKTFGVTPKPKNKISRATSSYNRQTAISNPRTLYIFTDNTDRTSGGTLINDGWYKTKYGNGGYGSDKNPTTAVIRGLDNAAPISTMRYFYRNHKNMTVNDARWTDSNLAEFKAVIDDEIEDIKFLWDSGDFDNVVVPSGDGFFNSKIANISKERTPKLYEYLRLKLVELNDYVNSNDNKSLKTELVISTSTDKESVDFGEFTNKPVRYLKAEFKTVEGAFQALKLYYSNYMDSELRDKYELLLLKFINATSEEAKQLGESIRIVDKTAWDNDYKDIANEIIETVKLQLKTESKPKLNLLELADSSEFSEMREEGRIIAGKCKDK